MHVGVGTQRVVVVDGTVVVLHVAVPTQASAVPHLASVLVSFRSAGWYVILKDILATAKLMRSAARVLVNNIIVVIIVVVDCRIVTYRNRDNPVSTGYLYPIPCFLFFLVHLNMDRSYLSATVMSNRILPEETFVQNTSS